MAIKVTFQTGQTEAKAPALHQWDYGQQLEIESTDLPTAFEVHFACQGMNEAIVHSCTAAGGIGAVVVPNRCLEQSHPITAWVYKIQGTTGTTIKTITIPVVPRTRPSRGDEIIPTEVTDKYTELISEVNEAVEQLTKGNVTVANAAKATSADRATQAVSAETSTYATSAGSAVSAGNAETAKQAEKATKDSFGDQIHTKYASFKDSFTPYSSSSILLGGTYQIKVYLTSGNWLQTIFTMDGSSPSYADLGWVNLGGQILHYRIFSDGGKLKVEDDDGLVSGHDIYYRRINGN